MEHHRLKPMKEGYDKNLFEDLYKKTYPLRRKLAHQIDARKFGVDYDEILSWFDVKFIHCFNKYHDTQPQRLLGYIINGLSMYKYRIMRSSYQYKYNNHANMIDISTYYEYDDIMDDTTSEALIREEYMEKIMGFMKDRLSDDALLVLDIQLNPPVFITSKLEEEGKKEYAKISNELLADYLGLPMQYINQLKSDVQQAISMAKHFFQNNPYQSSLG